MNHYAIRSGDETRSSFAIAPSPMFSPVVSHNCRFRNHHSMGGGSGGAVVCPKPRRVSLLNSSVNDSSLHKHLSHQAEMRDSKAGAEILDLILTKGGEAGIQRFNTNNHNNGNFNGKVTQQVASSPPFFSGSPPSRVSNPLIQDARFLEGPTAMAAAATPWSPTTASSPGSARKGGGCVRANFGNSPAVRVEGFDCLDRRGDRNRNCSIPALA